MFKKIMQKFTSKSNSTTDIETPPQPEQQKPPYLFEQIKVAGVTFKNGKKSRQTILRKIHFRDEPYTDGVELGLKYYEYDGAPAYYITANDEPIGNVPAEKVAYIDELIEAGKIVGITAIKVYGGGRDDEGRQINYGAEITIKIKND